MKFIELAQMRCSIRGYKPDAVADDLLEEVLAAGVLAPTAKNLQPFQFVVVRDEAMRRRLAKGYPAPFFAEAPVIIVGCVEYEKGWTRDRYDGKNYAEIDATIALDHMTLAAADAGLATCWIGAFDPSLAKDVLGIPEGVEPIGMLVLGYANVEPREKVRKSLSELVRYERW